MGNPTAERSSFFVVMRNRSTPQGGLIPFMDEDACLLTWVNAQGARDALKEHMAVKAWGAMIFNFDTGESEEL